MQRSAVMAAIPAVCAATVLFAGDAAAQYTATEKPTTFSYAGFHVGGGRRTATPVVGDTRRDSAVVGALTFRKEFFSFGGPNWFAGGLVGGGVGVTNDEFIAALDLLAGLQAGVRLPDLRSTFGVRVFNWWTAHPLRTNPDNVDDAMWVGGFFNVDRVGFDLSYALRGEYLLTNNAWNMISAEGRYRITDGKYPDMGWFAGVRYDYSWRTDTPGDLTPETGYKVHSYFVMGGVQW